MKRRLPKISRYYMILPGDGSLARWRKRLTRRPVPRFPRNIQIQTRTGCSAQPGEGSWICMTVDHKGRLIISPQRDDQPLLRVTLTRSGQVQKIEPIPAPLRQAMGLCFAHDSLYVNGHGPSGTGLYRLMDENRNDQFDTGEVCFLKTFQGEGEHGYHAVVAGPDGKIYVMNGNHTKVPEGIAPESPHRNYQEDLLLTRNGTPAVTRLAFSRRAVTLCAPIPRARTGS